MLVLPLPAEVVVAAVVEPVVVASPDAAFRRLVVAGPFSGLEAGGDVGPATLGVDGGGEFTTCGRSCGAPARDKRKRVYFWAD